jgi:hypothetical protein
MGNWLKKSPDAWAVGALVILWAVFFWRLFTPNTPDALSLAQGDFSGQFVSWTRVSVERFSQGQIPLWNPYMNAGAPFLADPQTAVFYPPRLLTVFVLSQIEPLGNGDIYFALQTEMTLHVLLGLLSMYALLRHLLPISQPQTYIASSGGALIFAFGGFMHAYAPLQLPILETFVWMPLVLLMIHKATQNDKNSERNEPALRWPWMIGGGVILAVALLAGHPQTLMFLAYTCSAYLVYRMWQAGHPLRHILLALGMLAFVTLTLSAVQWLPTAEFQQKTYRADISFAERSNGFAMQDFLQFVFAGLLGPWTPLYIGILGLLASAVALWRKAPDSLFWAGVAALGLLIAFGGKLVVYNILYLILPGFSLFRGPERAVMLVATAGSVLSAHGLLLLLTWDFLTDHKGARQILRAVLGLILLTAIFAGAFFILRVQPDGEAYQDELDAAVFALLLSVLCWTGLRWILRHAQHRFASILVLAILIFDLFSVNMSASIYEPIPATDRLPRPTYIVPIADNLDKTYRIEGLVGLPQSYASLFRLPDIWGNSPLRYDSMEFYLWQVPVERRWELLAVQIVNAQADDLPVPHQRIATGADFIDGRVFNIYELDDPRPFAHMVYQVTIAPNQGAARGLTRELAYPARTAIILEKDLPELKQLQTSTPNETPISTVEVLRFEPEAIRLKITTTQTGILSLAMPYEGGWRAKRDGDSVEILRAYGGLSAVVVPAGDHLIELYYTPRTYMIGRAISGLSWLGLVGIFLWRFISRRRRS